MTVRLEIAESSGEVHGAKNNERQLVDAGESVSRQCPALSREEGRQT
jgi:hypothetical protein